MTQDRAFANGSTHRSVPRRVRWTILAGAAVFLSVLALVAASLITQGRQAALVSAERDAVRFVAGAEAALNRNLLIISIQPRPL